MEQFTLKSKKRKFVEDSTEQNSDSGEPPANSAEDEPASDQEPEENKEEQQTTAEVAVAVGSTAPATNITKNTPDPALDPRKKRKLQVIIRAYRNNPKFGPKLEGISFDGMESMSVEELENVLADIRFLMNCSAPGSVTRFVVTNGIKVLEKVTTAMDFKTEGLETVLNRNPEFADLLDEVCLEHAEMTELSATARMGIMLLNTARIVHDMNSTHQVQIPENSQVTPDFLRSRYKDL